MAIIMPEEPRCPICLGEFNNTDCIPYIACQKGGHAFCKGCIRDMIPKSRFLDVTRITEEQYAVFINFRVSAPMAKSQIQFNCPVCREETPLLIMNLFVAIQFFLFLLVSAFPFVT